MFLLTAIIILMFSKQQQINGKLIAGGQTVQIEAIPYIVSLQNNETKTHFCGGSIIDEKWILTAAHCLVDSAKYYIRAGSSLHNNYGSIYDIQRIIIHPEWNPQTIHADIAIVEVNQSIPLTMQTKKISLPKEQDESIAEPALVRVSGWGLTNELDYNGSEQLQSVQMLTVDKSICQEFYRNTELTTSMICAEIPGEGKGSCSMDSGGPLVYKNTYLIGIVSWGSGCGGSYPGVYTKVSHFRNWIREITGI